MSGVHLVILPAGRDVQMQIRSAVLFGDAAGEVRDLHEFVVRALHIRAVFEIVHADHGMIDRADRRDLSEQDALLLAQRRQAGVYIFGS